MAGWLFLLAGLLIGVLGFAIAPRVVHDKRLQRRLRRFGPIGPARGAAPGATSRRRAVPPPHPFTPLLEYLSERISRGVSEEMLLREVKARLEDHPPADFLSWLATVQPQPPAQVVRVAQLLACARIPLTTWPNTTDYEWAGSSLQKLLGAPSPIAETWPFFSGPSKAAVLTETHPAAGPITMADLTRQLPEVLGPAGADAESKRQKYFFVKFIDPSDFPPFAYVGFNPEPVAALRRRLEDERRLPFSSDEQFQEELRRSIADLLWQDRRALEEFAALARPQVTSEPAFLELKAAYKSWAIAEATADWTHTCSMTLEPFVAAHQLSAATALLLRQQTIRQELIQLLHRINFEERQAILIQSPTVHAIAGLSLQLHPRAPGNFHPKDELWIYKPVWDATGHPVGWVLVEPQRTFDKTESGADFFTPFAWRDGVLGFRKAITQAHLAEFAALMDVTPRPRADFIRTAQPIAAVGATMQGQVEWLQLTEEPAWPYFRVRELRFAGAGEATTPLEHHSFIELHCTRGQIDVTLHRQGVRPCMTAVTPARPVFLPASLPYDTITYRATAPAQLQLFTRPLPSSS